MAEPLTFRLKALTDVWTGGVDQQCDRLHETGLIGSLRWWYEALVRGLGGSACDPIENSPCRNKDHCAACELFGCTGWSRKFRLRVWDDKRYQIIQDALGRDTDFQLQFVELRPMEDEEKWLLAEAVEIAAEYGALGGKTTLKPQAKKGVGDDYGIVSIMKQSGLPSSLQTVRQYLNDSRDRSGGTSEPDLRWFFFAQGDFLRRQQMNTLMDSETWLRGRRGDQHSQASSKKVFSFQAGGGRVWGYAQDARMRDQIISQLRQQLSPSARIKTGEEVISEL